MPAFKDTLGIRRCLLAGVQIFVLGGLLWAGEYALVRAPAVLHLYRKPFAASLAHRFAGQLARVELADKPAVLLLGPSTVREGFSEATMNQTVPEFRFLNGGSTGSTVFALEGLSLILDQYDVRPTCIVVGLNSRMLVHRRIGLNGQKYTDFMDLFNGKGLAMNEDPALRADAFEDIRVNTVVPVHRLSRQIDRLVRYGLYHLQTRWSLEEHLPQEAFERRDGDLNGLSEYMYDDVAPRADRLAAQLENIQKLGLLDREQYAQQEHLDSLHRTLKRCLQAAPTVVVLIMPERSEVRSTIGSYADEALDEILCEYEEAGCIVLDRRENFQDDAFRDIAHLLPKGRSVFSAQIAQTIASLLEGDPHPASDSPMIAKKP